MLGFDQSEQIAQELKDIHEEVSFDETVEPLSHKQILSLLNQTSSRDAMWTFFDNETHLQTLLERCVAALNSNFSNAVKTDALFLYSKLARATPNAGQLLEALSALAEGFESSMEREAEKILTKYASEKVRARSKLLELMLITLARLQKYNLTAQELLQFTNNDERKAVALLQSLLE
ncbi:hypothetical protein CYMTET_43821, partial [Cymbomonas tetramitiformis]